MDFHKLIAVGVYFFSNLHLGHGSSILETLYVLNICCFIRVKTCVGTPVATRILKKELQLKPSLLDVLNLKVSFHTEQTQSESNVTNEV